MLERICVEDGHTVRAVPTIPAAVEALARERFDAVLSDSFSGLEGRLGEAQSLLEAAGDTPVIAHTAWPVDRREAMARGFVEVLQKPADLNALLRTLQDAAERKKP